MSESYFLKDWGGGTQCNFNCSHILWTLLKHSDLHRIASKCWKVFGIFQDAIFDLKITETKTSTLQSTSWLGPNQLFSPDKQGRLSDTKKAKCIRPPIPLWPVSVTCFAVINPSLQMPKRLQPNKAAKKKQWRRTSLLFHCREESEVSCGWQWANKK